MTSLAIGGRGPTMLMSPRRTLMNCGNSSSEYLRRMRPRRVMRGSLVILNSTPSRSFMCMNSERRFSASRTMVRNLIAAEYPPLFADTLGSVEDGPLDSSLMAMARRMRKGDSNRSNAPENKRSNTRFKHEAEFGNLATMERNGRELADVLDGAVPGESVVEVGNHAEINAVHAGLSRVHPERFRARRGW